jgi:hypothetical protein
MPTRAVAEFVADAALKNAIANHSWKAAGPISMKCNGWFAHDDVHGPSPRMRLTWRN